MTREEAEREVRATMGTEPNPLDKREVFEMAVMAESEKRQRATDRATVALVRELVLLARGHGARRLVVDGHRIELELGPEAPAKRRKVRR